MSEILIYVVMKRDKQGITNTFKAFDSLHTAKSFARQLSLNIDESADFYVEKCFLRTKK